MSDSSGHSADTRFKQAVAKSKGEPSITAERTYQLGRAMDTLRAMLPLDVRRIEIDIEYADGGRVKLEGKA